MINFIQTMSLSFLTLDVQELLAIADLIREEMSSVIKAFYT